MGGLIKKFPFSRAGAVLVLLLFALAFCTLAFAGTSSRVVSLLALSTAALYLAVVIDVIRPYVGQ